MGIKELIGKDKEYQQLQSDLAELREKGVKDRNWYLNGVNEIRAKIKARYKLLYELYLNPINR